MLFGFSSYFWYDVFLSYGCGGGIDALVWLQHFGYATLADTESSHFEIKIQESHV